MDKVTRTVIVGVTGMHENTDALRLAIDEALLRDGEITLVHAVHPVLPPPPPSILIMDADWIAVGDGIVRGARKELDELLGDSTVPVSSVVQHGNPASVISELSKGAALVVLQHQDISRLHRIFTGSTVASVAAHSHAPVVSVPSGAAGRPGTGVVAVGVRSDGGPREVLEAAFAAAAARSSELLVVHGWRVPPAYEDVLVRWSAQDDENIAMALADLRQQFPEVDVHVDVQHEWPADVLAEAATGADLLVVGRHDGLLDFPPRLGSLARAAVAHADCPVMIVPV